MSNRESDPDRDRSSFVPGLDRRRMEGSVASGEADGVATSGDMDSRRKTASDQPGSPSASEKRSELNPLPSTGASTSQESDSNTEVPTEGGPDADAAFGDAIDVRPYIHITPAREQVTPGNIVSGLFGLYRAGRTATSRFNLKDRLGLADYDTTFEFIIHKPRGTQRFDFYLSISPFDVTSFKNLAANVRAMYPETFEFEIVPFNAIAAFAREDGDARTGAIRLPEDTALRSLANLQGFAESRFLTPPALDEPEPHNGESGLDQQSDSLRSGEIESEKTPVLVRWNGVQTQRHDWMTLIHPFTDTPVDADEQYRSPLSVLLEQAVHSDDSFVFQAVFQPREDWSKQATDQKRNLKMGNNGTLSAFKNEFLRQVFGTSKEERQHIHRSDISEQVGGSVTGGDAKIGESRMAQIDHKQPTTTFDVTLRAAGEDSLIHGIASAFTSLSGPYYGIEGDVLGRDSEEFSRLCHAEPAPTGGLTNRFKKTRPQLVVSPDELANFVAVPNTDALPRASRGSSGGTPDARSPLTATDEDLLGRYDYGMHLGYAETAVDNRDDIPIRLSAEQLTHHILRAATTGGGKTTSMINDALSAYESFDGPIIIFDKKGGSMSAELKRAFFHKFGSLEDVVHIPVPGPDDEILAFPYFDIRPQLAAGVSRTVAVQEKVDRYNELLTYVLGEELTSQAFVAQEILNSLIKALFDPRHGSDAFPIDDLFAAAFKMQEGDPPDVSDPTLRRTLARHLNADEQRFQTSIDAVMNRITKLAERDFIWRILNFVPEWDDERQCYADQDPMFDIESILDSKKVILIDTGDLRPASSNLFTFMLLDYIWSGARLRHRRGTGKTPADGYVINLIIDEAAPMLQSALVRDEMIPDGREFALSLEVIVHFAEQVKADALDVAAYKEILRNINTKLIGKLAVDDELILTLFHEGLEPEELVNRVTSLPRGEWIAQLPDTGFMTDIPELVTLLPVDIPAGHSDSATPVLPNSRSPTGVTFHDADAEMMSFTRDRYCLIPANNSRPSANQISAAEQEPDAATSPSGTAVSQPSASSNGEMSNSPSGAARNEFGTQLGSGGDSAVTPSTDTGRSKSARDQDLTRDEESTECHDEPVASESNTATSRQDAEPKPSTASSTRGRSTTLGTRLGGEPLGSSRMGSDGEEPQGDDDETTSTADGGLAVGSSGTESGTESPENSEVNKESFTSGDDELTVDERNFLRAIVATVNGVNPEFDLLDSMTQIRDSFDEVDPQHLIDLGYLEKHDEIHRVYYTVTRAGQDASGTVVATGENQGDRNEKTFHKVMVESLARTLDADSTNQYFITKYAPINGTDARPDLVAYDGEQPVCIGEAITNVQPELIVKHYDDYNQFPNAEKVWIVANKSAAWDIVRALANAGRINLPPERSKRSYRELAAAIWGEDSDWTFANVTELVDALA